MNKSSIKFIIRLAIIELVNIFGIIKIPQTKRKEMQLANYFDIIGNDLKCSFQKIKSSYERE